MLSVVLGSTTTNPPNFCKIKRFRFQTISINVNFFKISVVAAQAPRKGLGGASSSSSSEASPSGKHNLFSVNLHCPSQLLVLLKKSLHRFLRTVASQF